jgi:hypothetical protein
MSGETQWENTAPRKIRDTSRRITTTLAKAAGNGFLAEVALSSKTTLTTRYEEHA